MSKLNIEQLEALIESQQSGVAILELFDSSPKLVYLSRGVGDIIGHTSEQMCESYNAGEGAFVYPTDLAAFNSAISRAFTERGSVTHLFRHVCGNGQIKWVRLSGTVMERDGRAQLYALVSDATDIKAEEDRYMAQMELLTFTNDDALCCFHFNLTRNTCDGRSPYPLIRRHLEKGTVDGWFESRLSLLPDDEQRASFQRNYSRESLLNAFSKGKTALSVEHLYSYDDTPPSWAETSFSMMQNPVSGDVEAIVVTSNLQNKKLYENIIERIVHAAFDFISVVDVPTGVVSELVGKASLHIHPESGHSYNNEVRNKAYIYIDEDEREAFLQTNTLEGVIAGLEQNEIHVSSYTMRNHQTNMPQRKLWQSMYLDDKHTKILTIRSDITRVYENDKRQRDALVAALAAAQQASVAKTDFLSRMSHEIRTPLNAIIGMSAIAAQNIGNDEDITNCISKISISSRYLLSLINDILDMCRIESGKLLIKNEPIPFPEFLSSINDIINAQAIEKGLDYECFVDKNIDDRYIGDSLKLQQVLVNMLGNSVKFTKPGGKISLTIRELRQTKNEAIVQFTITDTGCGISEEFMPRLFDSFAQERDSTLTAYSGSGLGLPICKSIVDLMDGSIKVRSIVGTGTEFTVEVKLGLSEEAGAAHNKPTVSLASMSVMVVDDDILVCEQTSDLLREMGMFAEWVDSGRKAIRRVEEKLEAHEHFDIILIDWKMPDMNGVETARNIRRLVGEDVTIIIISAYDWATIEHEARKAGVNMFISKPMFKSSITSAFERAILDRNAAMISPREPIDFDFSGKRVLIAEDHALNYEVARRLLESKGFAVEHAENGSEAIEKFAVSANGYYDAILMDIRMPILDGLQASNAIRHMHMNNAQTIPIIAMTANAFDSDVDKAKAAGMSGYLAKPVEPADLYKTLYNQIFNKDDSE